MPPPSARCAFRELDDADLPALRSMLGNPLAMAAYEGPFDEAEVRAWLSRQRDRYSTDGLGLWALERRDDRAVIGQCGLMWQDVEGERVLEVGYHLVSAFWHRGYAAEAAGACRDFAFSHLGIARVHAIVRDTNLASMNVAIRCGMTARRRLVKHYRGVDMPHYLFAVDSPG
ncbi:MAG: GNAT family N-acetyltransferase [Actinomycetia bacterium]|nr:GNAT family N-acetyltransferase [Actinomycetes bacterium]